MFIFFKATVFHFRGPTVDLQRGKTSSIYSKMHGSKEIIISQLSFKTAFDIFFCISSILYLNLRLNCCSFLVTHQWLPHIKDITIQPHI